MGNPLAPIIADLWMQKMEGKLNRFSTNKPMIWLRYVDDIFCIFTIPKDKIDEFHTRISGIVTYISLLSVRIEIPSHFLKFE